MMRGLLFALIAQVVFSLIVWFVEGTVPEGVRRGARIAGGLAAAGVVVVGLGWGWATFQSAGGIAQLKGEIQAETVSADPDELSQDQTERYTSLHAGDRIMLWKIAWENWLRHPLTGTGGDTYAIVHEQETPEDAWDSLYAHSIWMDLLSDTGNFAFLAFAAFSVGVLAVAAYNALYKKRSRRSQALIAGSAAAASAYLISSSVDWNWYIPASTLPFFALAAVATGMARRNRKERPATTP